MTYEVCPQCQQERAAGMLEEALNCRDCKGKGIVRDPASYVCNGCGGPLCPAGTANERCPHGLVEETVSGGYDSPDLTDTQTYTFSLCEACLRKLFDTFKVPPRLGCFMGEGAENYAEERAWYQRRKWREAKGHIEKLKQGLCNQTIECQNKATIRMYHSTQMSDDICCDEHRHGAGNTWYVPAYLVAGIVRGPDNTTEERLRIAEAWLGEANHPGAVATLHRHLPACVADYVGAPSDGNTMLWVPITVPWSLRDSASTDVQTRSMHDGTVFFGPAEVLRAAIKNDISTTNEIGCLDRLKVRRAHILPDMADWVTDEEGADVE